MPPRLGWAQSLPGARTGSADSVAPTASPALSRSRRVSCGESFEFAVPMNALLRASAASRGVTAWPGRPERWGYGGPLRAPHLLFEPECGGPAAVVEARVRRVVFHMGLPGSDDANRVEIDVVLLLGGIPLDVEDELPADFQLPDAHLLLQHPGQLGVIDVAAVARLLGQVHPIEGAVWFPGDRERAHRNALELSLRRRRHVGAVFLDLQLRLDAAFLELALDELEGVDQVGAETGVADRILETKGASCARENTLARHSPQSRVPMRRARATGPRCRGGTEYLENGHARLVPSSPAASGVLLRR